MIELYIYWRDWLAEELLERRKSVAQRFGESSAVAGV
jgi:hypothetical protein